jgi:acetylornithine deacetylase
VDSIVADVRRTLDPLVAEDPDLKYEIEIPVPESIKGARRIVMEPFDLPKEQYIVGAVARGHKRVTGKPPKAIGAVLPLSMTPATSGKQEFRV